MTLREALKFRFKKHTITTQESGDSVVYHYFSHRINGVLFNIDCTDTGEWVGRILELSVVFYDSSSFKNVMQSIERGEWDECG